jgi:hypothetical protein
MGEMHSLYLSRWSHLKWECDHLQGINTDAATKYIAFMVVIVSQHIKVGRVMLLQCFHTDEEEEPRPVTEETVEDIENSLKVSVSFTRGGSSMLLSDAGLSWDEVRLTSRWWNCSNEGSDQPGGYTGTYGCCQTGFVETTRVHK